MRVTGSQRLVLNWQKRGEKISELFLPGSILIRQGILEPGFLFKGDP